MKVVLDISSSHRHLPSPSLAEMRLMHIGRFHSPRLVMLGAIAAIVAAVLCLALGARVQAYGPAPVRETDLLVSVKSFGAIGDGRADDRTAVIKAFRSGHAVFFPRGTYRIGATIDFGALRREEGWMQPSVVMVGEGPRLSRLVYSGRGVMLIGGRTAPSVGGYEQRLTIRDLSLTGSASSAPKPVRTLGLFRTKPNEFAGTSSEQAAVFWEFDGSSVIERDEFTNFGTAISTKAGYGFVVRNNVFRYNGIALLLEKAVTTGVIEQNLIERNDIAIGLWMASQIRITNNAIQANYGGADIVSYNWNTQIFVTENYFEASPVGFFHSGDSGGEYISNNYYFYRNKALAVKLGKLAKNFVFEGNRIQSFECSGPGSEVSLVDNYDDRKDGLVPYRAPADGGSLACLRHVPTP